VTGKVDRLGCNLLQRIAAIVPVLPEALGDQCRAE